ncbi:cysteine hydrolase [Mycolicibacterium sp. P1-18]|uniref:cysteine hydrolase family protein n=1 Tax=Mycolicibacterium sp. P1-18 TaxID=2024615 RepID=UPI0011F25D28|nr:isochorismatase family cysteine hydrolase [Mycolicibacterium sp. P1-18]KAA0092794.1 cysteine hydrolase [Mycolicibacterium sp. P1-18]
MDDPWLVAIDLQEVFRQPDSGWFTPRYDEAAAGTLELLPLFGPRVVFTRFVAPTNPIGAWVDYYEKWPFALIPADDPLYDLSAEFASEPHAVVSATTLGKWGPDLAAAMNGSREMVLTGVATDCCVLSTALAAADAGVHVQVVADACAGVSDRDHQRALEAMALYAPLVDVTTVERVRRQLS